ncbi:MAG: hypothetical protein ACRDKT_04890 [Actinomycetota bacterium]
MATKLSIALSAGLLIAAVAPPVQADPVVVAEEHGITCSLTGEAKLKPGLNMDDGEYKVTFTGELSDCLATGDASSGTVKAKAVGSGTCGHNTTEGVAMIKWDNKTKTIVDFSTEGAGATVLLTATVTKSNESSLVEGDDAFGLLVFQADPTACESDAGVTEAGFNGQVGGGSPQ